MSKSVWVYAHWHSMEQPELVGILEVDLVRGAEVAPYFQLSATQSKEILTELRSVTDNWQQYANEIGINRQEQQLLELILF
ncbi:hypothetical protein [Endozoicomonas sp. YOMI1]|uniref:hypothetical protein n=1 Tax=Endozoicomonas sp. YOMI1 TaxID=2828739 RepID=UPI0021494B76|nr:hypothetical protein [Endozoicomonas sp. YOMI1]